MTDLTPRMPMLAHLHVHSWFSFLAGGSSPEALAARAAALAMPALALTDTHGVYGAVRFQKACRAHGIKPIVGAEVTIAGHGPLVLLVQSQRGYANLCRMLTAAHETSRTEPATTLDVVAHHAGDIICLTGGRDGALYSMINDGRTREAHQWLMALRTAFGDRLYVELCHYFRPHNNRTIARLHATATHNGIGVVATGDVRYAEHDDYARYDLQTCIRLGLTVFEDHPERPVNGESYLKSEEQLRRLIPYPDAFTNTAVIADACSLDLLPGHVTSPGARLPEGVLPFTLLHDRTVAAVEQRYPRRERERAMKQLANELAVVGSLGLEEYFLVVAEVTDEARRRRIRCAGRGSAANSIIAYLLGITGVDPLAHNLLFERFLHGGRKSIPDIDVDFDSERREEIIAWMEERFGTEQTAMTATVITYGLRMALRDTAKALGWPLPIVDRLTRAVPHRPTAHIGEHREGLAEIVGESVLLETLITMTASLDGCPRHLGLHSGGMILSRRPLYECTPIQRSAGGVAQVQFDKNDVESLGLIKLDILGLRMLAAVNEAAELIEQSTGVRVDIDALPLDDEETFGLIRRGETLGTFQIESQGQMHLLALNQPSTFNDLIAEVALHRPGPLQSGMVKPYINRRHGREKIEYDHPDLVPILRDTYGVILYQEQVLDVAHRFAGMSLAAADDFRSLMSKFRSRTEMEGMRARFVGGAVGRGVDQKTADMVFDKLAHFVGYGFCRSHAAAFAKTVYQSCWLKQHHPAAFMGAIMQHRPGMYSLMTLEQEARRMGVPVLFPDVNRSGIRYELECMHGRDGAEVLAIRKPLTSVTELSAEDARAIVLERTHGAFTSVEDLYARVAMKLDAWENLARSGALDALAGSSRHALWQIGVLVRRLGASGTRRAACMFDLPMIEEADIPRLAELTLRERLTWDYAAQSSARVHPIVLVRRRLSSLEVRPIATAHALTASEHRPAGQPHPMLTIAGVVILRQMPETAKGVLFITLEDESGLVQCIAYPQLQEQYGRVLRSAALIVRGEVQITGAWRGVIIHDVWPLDGMLGGYEGYASAIPSHGAVIETDVDVEESMEGYQEALFPQGHGSIDGELQLHGG